MFQNMSIDMVVDIYIFKVQKKILSKLSGELGAVLRD